MENSKKIQVGLLVLLAGLLVANMFGGGPFASATQSGQQAQQPQQSNAPARTGGVF